MIETLTRILRKVLAKPARWVLRRTLDDLKVVLASYERDRENLLADNKALREKLARLKPFTNSIVREQARLVIGRENTPPDQEETAKVILALTEPSANPAGFGVVCPFSRWGADKAFLAQVPAAK